MTDYLHIQLPPDQIRGISSIGLAHMGDAVYELLVRTWLCAHGKATGKGLHRATVALVCAPKQAELAQRSPFLMLAEEVPEAREHMGRFALAMAQQSDGSLVLLATERNLLTLNRASAEEIQDHRCAILNANH